MPHRFSQDLLFRLRNDVPVELVITRLLEIPSKLSEGYLRFLCPICSEFNSSVNPMANLARCFRCNKNFNPIDLVMAQNGVPFTEAVHLLCPLLPETNARDTLPSQVAPSPPHPALLPEGKSLRLSRAEIRSSS